MPESIKLAAFRVGDLYSRDDVASAGEVTAPVGPRDPVWSQGVVRFDNAVLLFVTLEKEGEYNYDDRFDGALFHWQSKNSHRTTSPAIRQILSSSVPTMLFARVIAKRRGLTQKFVYCGRLEAQEHAGECPVTVQFRMMDRRDDAVEELAEVYEWRPEGFVADTNSRELLIEHFVASGQGRLQDSELRKEIEHYAMRHATAHYVSKGFEIEETYKSHPYDLVARSAGSIRRVEVKGTQSKGESVFVTIGEVEAARDPSWITDLFVVHGIVVFREGGRIQLHGGEVTLIEAWRPNSASLRPTQFVHCLPKVGGAAD